MSILTKSRPFLVKALTLTVLLLLISLNLTHAQSGWFAVKTDTLVRWQWNFFTDANTGYTVGSKIISGIFYPRIIKTTNAGINWYEQVTPQRDSANWLIRCVFFTDANTGFVTLTNVTNTNSGRILRTINGGNNWSIVPLPVDKNMSMVAFVNSSTGYATGHATILKTTNVGETWMFQDPFFSFYLFGIHFNNVNTGYVVGNTGTILKTTNGGTNWLYINSTTTVGLCGVYFTDANTGIVAGGHDNNSINIILRTTNAGDNWQVIPYAYSNCLLWSVRFTSAMTGYIIGWCGQVLKTTNCGLNWYNQTLPVAADSFWGRSCFFTNAETGYLVGQPNNVSGYFSYIFKTTNSGEPSGIKPVSNEIPSKFSLYQNYPNPFNPITKIKFDLQKSEYTVLTIFDVLGREVAVLVSEQLKPGTYEVEWEGSNYPSGVYFCKIKASEFTDVKKMILVK